MIVIQVSPQVVYRKCLSARLRIVSASVQEVRVKSLALLLKHWIRTEKVPRHYMNLEVEPATLNGSTGELSG